MRSFLQLSQYADSIQFFQYINMISSENQWPALGDYVDFKDKDNNPWQVGLVIHKVKNIVKIRTQGWSNKFDELLQASNNNNRIRPFRSLVRGYTGQQKNPAIRDHWKFTPESHTQKKAELSSFLKQIELKSEKELVQFIRGQHYFYLDFLLAQTYTSQQILAEVYQYLKEHLNFAKDYLEKIIETGISSWCTEEQTALQKLSEYQKGYRGAYFQVLDGVHILSGMSVRQLSFHKNNDKLIKEIEQNITHEKYMAKYMSQIKIDDSYLKLMHVFEKETFEDNKVIPLPFIYIFFHLFAPIEKALLQKSEAPYNTIATNKDERKKIVLRIFNILKKQFQYLTPQQIKAHQTEKQIESLLAEMKVIYFKYGLEQLVFEWIEKTKLKVSFLLIQCDSLERKLKGIAKLKQLYEVLLTSNESNVYKLSKEQFRLFLKQNNIIQSLFLENEHPEILKKGCQVSLLMLKSDLMQLTEIILIWQECSHKHEAVRKVIYQLWIDIVSIVPPQDLYNFVEPILSSIQQKNEGEEKIVLFVEQWQIQLLFTFIFNSVKAYEQLTIERQQLDKTLLNLIEVGYRKLLELEKSSNMKHFISEFAKIINISLLLNRVMKQAYNQVAKHEHLELNLCLLTSIYQQSVDKDTFIPSNAIEVIFFVLQSPNNNHLSTIIFRLMDEVINFSSHIREEPILDKSQFQNLWRISQQNEEVKAQLYSWLVVKNSDGLFGVPIYQINSNIPASLRSDIFNNFLCNHEKIDYFNFSSQELLVFKQFMTYQNEWQKKIEIKKLMTLIKIVRLRQNDIVGTKYMWDIFLNCKNEEVIKQLSKIIITFHFYFYEMTDMKNKKLKLSTLLNKIEKHIKDGFKKGNLKLMKHSLILLKDMIDFVKEKKPPASILQHHQQYFKTTIKVQFEKKKYELEIFYGITYYEIKSKVAEIIKVERTKFQMYNSKGEEISLEYAEVPFCFMQEKIIRIMVVEEKEETVPNIVLNFVKDRIEDTLIDMLEDETICENVFHVLEDIQIKVQEGEELLEKVDKIISKHEKQKKEESNKYEIYFYLFYLKILQFLIEKPKFLQKFIRNRSLNKLIGKLEATTSNPLTITYLAHAADAIFKIIKFYRARQNQFNEEMHAIISDLKQPLKEKCILVICQLCDHINSHLQQHEANYLKNVKIVFNCLNIIQNIELKDTLTFLVNHHKFQEMLDKIYLKPNINEIRMIFAQKLKKMIKSCKQRGSIQQQMEQKISSLLISNLYDKIRQVQGVYVVNKKVIYFYRLIAYIITNFSKQHFKKYVLGPEDHTFYSNLIKNIKLFEDSKEPTAVINYLLSSHLEILTSIYQKEPTLFKQDAIIDYIIYDCLFHKDGKSSRSDNSCKKPESVKAAIDVLEAGTLQYQNPQKLIKIISEIEEFHRIEYWRTSDYWSSSVENEVKAKYVGLQNPGCICYCNSLLQQLFMTQSFRKQIYSLNLEREQGREKIQILQCLKELFFELEYSQQIALNPVFFTKSIKNHENKPMIKLFVQMDIDQFCSILFDKIEQQINFIPAQPNFVKDVFGGVYAHQIISKECNHSSEREEQFISIGLEVKKNILQSFSALIKGQMLDGQNKYYCQKCDKKVKAQKMLTIKTLPKTLILSLKRFEFNYQIDAKIKINDYCEFPMELNLKKYSQQQINRINTLQKINTEQQFDQQESKELADDYFNYRLKGVVVHTGSADSGHYYSFVEDNDKGWFEFNDIRVTPFDVNNLPDETFGSKDAYEDKIKNAYLLFYEKVESKQSLESQPENAKQSEQNSKIISEIIDKNKTINKYRLLFSKDYSQFIKHIHNNISKFELNLQQQQRWHSFILSYFLLVKIREGTVSDVQPLAQKILTMIQSDKRFSDLFLDILSNFNFLEEMFVYCSNRDKSRIIGSLLTSAFMTYYTALSEDYPSLLNEQMQNLFHNITHLTILHGNIYEVEMFVRSVFDLNKKHKDDRLIRFMIEQCNLHRVTMLNLFALPITKEEKQASAEYKEKRKNDFHPIVGSSKNEGKKYLPSQAKQSWHLLEYFMRYLLTEESKKQQTQVLQSQQLMFLATLIDKIVKNGTITRIIHQCQVSKGIYHLFNVFRQVGKVNLLIEAIQKGLKDFESTKYRPLLMLLQFIVGDKQSSDDILKATIEMLVKVHAVNQKYFLEVNFIHQWMLKYASISPRFEHQLSENIDFLHQITNWIIAKPLPSLELLKKHKNPQNERLMHRLNGIMVSTDPKDYHNKSKIMQINFQKIKQSILSATEVDLKWEDQYSDQFQVGCSVSFYDNQEWVEAKVLENNFGRLKIQEIKQENEHELWQDNERISRAKLVILVEQLAQEKLQEEQTENIEEQDLYN